MNFGQAISSGFSNYVNFSDRACRSEYWYWFLFVVLGQFVTAIVDSVIGIQLTTGIFSLVVASAGHCRQCAAAARSGSQRLVAVVGFCPAGRHHHPDRLVLHAGHAGSEPVRAGSAERLRTNQPAPSSLIASSRANR